MTETIEFSDKTEPDIRTCRTRPLGIPLPGSREEISYCETENVLCRYGRPIGFDCLCRHPNHLAFRTPLS